ncbi:MAG: hypothetical protein AB1450_07815 [Pseudomonadota bacterium]
MTVLRYGVVALLLLGGPWLAQADWWIAYSPVIVKYTGQSTYCCFPTKAACEAARAQKLQPNDSIGCFGYDSPSVKQQSGGQSKQSAAQQAKAAADAQAQKEAQLKLQEQKFREAMQGTLQEFKGLDSGGGSGGLTLKPVPSAGGDALGQLRGSAAWSDAATRAKTDEEARTKAELGAQGAGGLKGPDHAGKVPEPPAPTPVEVQRQFVTLLSERKQVNRQQTQQAEQQIRTLEQKLQASEEEAARQERELAGLKLKEAPAAQPQESDAQRRAREALERARAEQQKLKQELERRRREREQLAQDEQRLQQLESQYQADPQRAGALMGQLGR